MKIYLAIDLKSFYASVECVERGWNPLTTNLVVADESRTDKTICLAVSPSLKEYGLPGRGRLFEINKGVTEINHERRINNHIIKWKKSSFFNEEVKNNKYCQLDYFIAKPRMKKYMEYSTKIYGIYLNYVSSEDIHVYSVDECFLDITNYLPLYKISAEELARKIVKSVYEQTGITATCGIGTNLFLCKVAMDIIAKHAEPDANGVRIGYLDEKLFRKSLWNHTPLTDFWRIGVGIEKRLNKLGCQTLGDVCELSLNNIESLYSEFGVNAELIIDHAWGVETTEMKDIKNYKTKSNSISNGQVLPCPYNYSKTKIIVKEMAEELAVALTTKRLKTKKLLLQIKYDSSSMTIGIDTETNHYGKKVPKSLRATINLKNETNSVNEIVKAFTDAFEQNFNKSLFSKGVNVTACSVVQVNLENTKKENLTKDEKVTNAMLEIKKRFGSSSIFKAINLEEGATSLEKNKQVGGHRA